MTSPYLILRTLLRSEKGAIQAEKENKYFFKVAPGSQKIEIRHAVEAVYKVKVKSVNTQVVPGKPKVVRRERGLTAEWKKAIVTLQPGQKIDMAA